MKRIELLNRIQEIYEKLENDKLDPTEIEELVDLSNSMYERALILRYKVAEQRIFGENQDQSANDIADKTDELSEVEIADSILPEPIDFSIFESKEDQILENNLEEIAPKTEEIVEIQTVELNFSEPEPLTDKGIKEPVINRKESESEMKDEMKLSPPPIDKIDIDWEKHFEKVLMDHSSGIQKSIESLAGSFGLNERILYINELFNGQAENFSNAVIHLDKIGDWHSGKPYLGQLANQESWDKESDTVAEFILHVKRRYV